MRIKFLNKSVFTNKLCFSLLVAVVPYTCYSQKKPKNLVPNPSFETSINKRGDISGASPWIGVGTVDYYLKPEKRDTSKFKGARTGTCYAGLRFQKEYKEYMYAPLTETLKEGETYSFEMFVRLLNFDNVTVTIKQLGACFSEEVYRDDMEFFKENIVDSTNENGLAGTLNWIRIHGDYLANGGEKYIILGNFKAKMKDDFVKKEKVGMFEFEEGYYYVDDVSLYLKEEKNDSAKKHAAANRVTYPETFTAGQTFEIKNLQFEEGGTRILRNSYKTLNELAQVLNNHPFMEIQLNLKADSQSLAKSRAKAVSDYLTEQGVVNPVKHKGMALPATAEKGSCVMEIVVLVP
ncbi:MAG: hypothetical protein WAQ28_00035 [Bacteroidia bacterium]